MKWEPVALMILLIALGAWLVGGPGREGEPIRFGSLRGNLIINKDVPGAGDAWTYTIEFREIDQARVYTEPELREILGPAAVDRLKESEGNALFKLFNITGWGSLIWVAIGFAGQIAFFGRMAVQWVVSEKKRQSVVPEVFWYLSLFGGIALFTYFVWRADFVGVLGQSSGIVIYARNIRLIRKKRRRDLRHAARAAARAAPSSDPAADPDAGEGASSADAEPDGGAPAGSAYADPAPEPLDRPS